MADESTIVIGASIAGLSADCYGQMNGYRTQIFEMSTSPAGKTTMRICLATDCNYWKNLAQDPQRYQEEKHKAADRVVAALGRRFPGLTTKVEMWDVSTP